jgi:DNA modification methylase
MCNTKGGAAVEFEATEETATAVGYGVVEEGYATKSGVMYVSLVESFLDSAAGQKARGTVQLIFTSPPFPLNRKKKYGNKTGEEYLTWLHDLAPRLTELLTPDGSIVMELGNAWEPGSPVMSTLALEAFLAFKEAGKLNLCQQFICHNPARLPSPAQWVNVERIRVKDSFTHIWWMSPTERPKADNRRVLTEYSEEMKDLLSRRSYNGGRRPSGHHIGEESFFKDNGGAIPPNVFVHANTISTDRYREYCRERGIKAHPAPMQLDVVRFFIKMLTDSGDMVLDPFGGSNSTGAMSEELKRKWIAVEPNREYVTGSMGRFPQFAGADPDMNPSGPQQGVLFTEP